MKRFGILLTGYCAIGAIAIPAFVQSYAWNSFAPGLNGFWGAVLVSILAYFPFLYLPVAAQLRRLDPTLEETAASLGLRPTAIFLRVILPQLRLAICGGALLVGLHLLSEYGLFVLMRFDTFATAIVDQFQSVYNGPAANLLGGVLVLLCVGLLGFEALVRGDARYARVGSGAPRDAVKWRLGRWSAKANMAGSPSISSSSSTSPPRCATSSASALKALSLCRSR